MNAKDTLREMGIYNSHNALRAAHSARVGPPVMITYDSAYASRFARSKWQVYDAVQPNDPTGWWGNYKHKTFSVFSRAEKQPQFEAAIAWASNRYGVAEWVKIPGLGGDLFPRAVADYLKGLVKAHKSLQKESAS